MKNPFSKSKSEEDAPSVEPGAEEETKKSGLSPSMKKTAIAVGAAGVLAISGVLMLVSYVKTAEDSAPLAVDLSPKATVYVVAEQINSGTTVEELRADNFARITLKEVSADDIPPGAITNADQLEALDGVMVDATLYPGERLLASRFVDTQAFSLRDASVEIPEGHHQASFRLSPVRVLGGSVRAGDDISISSAFEATDGYPRLTAVVLTSVEVVNVQVEGLVPLEEPTEETQESRDALRAAPTTEFIITVAVTEQELAKLHYAIDYGRILVAAASDDPSRDVTAVETMESLIKDAGGELDPETGTFTVNTPQRASDPAQLAFVDGEPVGDLQSPTDAFANDEPTDEG